MPQPATGEKCVQVSFVPTHMHACPHLPSLYASPPRKFLRSETRCFCTCFRYARSSLESARARRHGRCWRLTLAQVRSRVGIRDDLESFILFNFCVLGIEHSLQRQWTVKQSRSHSVGAALVLQVSRGHVVAHSRRVSDPWRRSRTPSPRSRQASAAPSCTQSRVWSHSLWYEWRVCMFPPPTMARLNRALVLLGSSSRTCRKTKRHDD